MQYLSLWLDKVSTVFPRLFPWSFGLSKSIIPGTPTIDTALIENQNAEHQTKMYKQQIVFVCVGGGGGGEVSNHIKHCIQQVSVLKFIIPGP